jgi:hypothetical protein
VPYAVNRLPTQTQGFVIEKLSQMTFSGLTKVALAIKHFL